MRYPSDREAQIAAAERELASLDKRRAALTDLLATLRGRRGAESLSQQRSAYPPLVRSELPTSRKVRLFGQLFRGREDVFARRFESKRTGKSGYQPACRNEWVKGVCEKPRVRCSRCTCRELVSLDEQVIKNHLLGYEEGARARREYVVGIYPLCRDDTCWFVAADFDGEAWAEDAEAFRRTCIDKGVPVSLERSRSGDGAHAWVFFSEPVSALDARRMGSYLVTEAMERHPGLGLNSYDRLFPSQDTVPNERAGFGNLIALPFQRKATERGNTLFVDAEMEPYPDQWGYLESVRRMAGEDVAALAREAVSRGRVVGVRMPVTDEDDEEPWAAPPSRVKTGRPVAGPLPERVDMVLGDQLYLRKDQLTPALLNRCVRLAAFQNPEFYKAQAMRLSTFGKPRIIACCEEHTHHIALPRGCTEEVTALLDGIGVPWNIADERNAGLAVDVRFRGELRPDQMLAAQSLLGHDFGVLSASTAFGKTVIGAYLIAERTVNTLVLVHRKQLMEQWVARLRTFLSVDASDVGMIGGGRRKPTGKIDVALIQSVCRKGVVDDIVGTYGQVIIDECHRITAPSFELVARYCKARYMTGLSATVTRKDGHHPIIFMQLGPLRHKVSDREQAALRPFEHQVVVRTTGFRAGITDGEGKTPIHEIYAALMQAPARDRLIVTDVLDAVRSGRTPLVLTERREHLDRLLESLALHTARIVVLTGGMGRRKLRAALDELKHCTEEEELIVLATGRYIGEGFDMSRLDTLFLAMPISWRGTLSQYAGRLHRLHHAKKRVVVYDYADMDVPVLAKMYERRRKGYKAIGYSIENGEPVGAKVR